MASNLLAAPLLFFALGVLSRVVRSDLGIPPALVRALSLYLLAGIGLHGGAELARSGLGTVIAPAAAALALAFATPLVAYALLRRALRLDGFNAAALAAHYGSVSIATFLAAAAYLQARGHDYEAAAVVMLALMEAPAILVGLALAVRLRARQSEAPRLGSVLGQTVTHGSVVLLFGTIAIGAFATPGSLETVEPFFKTMFMGALCLFLVQMGVDAAAKLREARAAAVPLVAFGLAMPLAMGAVGVAVGHYLLGFSVGGTTLVATLAASASYIAVPPAMRLGVPEANPSLYLLLALGVTFPFNLLVGVPLFHWAAGMLAA